MKKLKKEQLFLILILALAFFSRVFRLWEPPTFMFDEVYHAFTAREMARGNKMAWEWWNTPPQGFAYEWTHPPLAKEAMAVGIKIFGENPFAWRFPVALAGVGVVYLVYLLGRKLFNERVGLISAFLITFDGLNFVQSRIGMNDTFFLFFMLLAFYLFLISFKERGECINETHVGVKYVTLSLMGISLGLALASKWTSIYAIAILAILFLFHCFKTLKQKPAKGLIQFFLVFLLIPILVYLFSYLPFFTSGHTWQQFNELQHQMWWYHTNLKATHPYTSPWYSWPFLYRPVWYYVNYGKETMANIYAMGNPVIWWSGIVAIGWLTIDFIRKVARHEFSHPTLSFSVLQSSHSTQSLPGKGAAVSLPASLPQAWQAGVGLSKIVATRPFLAYLIVLAGYFGFFLPWVFSPRIMFLYHYLPSVPFMCLALGFGLGKIWEIGVIREIRGIRITGKMLTTFYLILATLTFIYFYPHLSALPVPKWLGDSYFWFPSWR